MRVRGTLDKIAPIDRWLEAPAFRASLARAVGETSAERPVLACRAEAGGWRYRPGDPLRPLYSIPDWGVQEDANWRWHHQSLALVSMYTHLHMNGSDPRALSALQAVISSWWRNADDPAFSWGEHTSALRLERLLRAFGALFDDLPQEFRTWLVSIISAHVDRLLGDVACRQHNHALDQIYALLLAKRYLPFLNVPEEELARRLADERAYLLSAENVVTENSPGYQSWIPARIAECQQQLGMMPDARLLADSNDFTCWIARPDGKWPEFGDTMPKMAILPKPAAPVGFRAFPHAGYAVWRNARTWFALKCGFLSHAHRHHDDGSFLLSVDGEDVFVEAGMFGYANGWEREFARSPLAHNISYRPEADPVRSTTSRRWQRHHHRWGIVDADGDERCWHVNCRSYMFGDSVYTRHVTGAGGVISVQDSFDTPGAIRTRFHVPAGRRIHVAPGRVNIDDRLELRHDLPDPTLIAGHHTIGYLSYGPLQVVEFSWQPDRVAARFEIVLGI
jgi:hypothetical protein